MLHRMNDDQLLRYSRHILLDELGIEGQRTPAGRACAGRSAPAAWARRWRCTWARAGVGRITLVDDDAVDLTNLQRQIAHNLSRVGQPKAESARQSIAAINPDVQVVARGRSAPMPRCWTHWWPQADVVLDCSDNFATRQAVNAACVAPPAGRWCRARRIGFDAQISVYDTAPAPMRPAMPASSRPRPRFEETRCATMGVFAPLVGIIGSMQAAEALKLLAGIGTLAGRAAADAGRAHDGMDADRRAARRALHGVCASPRRRSALSCAP